MECQEITVSECELFGLVDFVDERLATSSSFKEDGVLKFRVEEGCGEGTSLQELLANYGSGLQCSLKKLNPIILASSKDLYGHRSIESRFLEKEIHSSSSILLDPASYTVIPEKNCCTCALQNDGLEGLLTHYFERVLKDNALKPPQLYQNLSVVRLKRKAKAVKRSYVKLLTDVKSQHSTEGKAAALRKALETQQNQCKPDNSYCGCDLCVTADDVEEEGDAGGQTDDVATAKHYEAKGFMYANGVDVGHNTNMLTANFSLSFLSCLSLTSMLEHSFPGIHSSYMYFGLVHSFFPVHVEDLSLWSVNYLHYGYAKVWIVVPPSAVAKLSFFLSKEMASPGHASCWGLLSHKYYVPTPSWLQRNGIPFKVVIQRRNEGVIVAPNAAHFGFNLGPNIAEAINFGTKFWVPYGIVYPRCNCMLDQIHGDLSSIIQSVCPEMLMAYLRKRIPKVVDQAHFCGTIVHSRIWKEAIEGGGTADIFHEEAGSTDVDEDGDEAAVLPMKLKKVKTGPNRKVLRCPVCSKVYQGGQSRRLIDHVNTNHSDLPVQDTTRVQGYLATLFPVRNKLPKNKCNICGKLVARSMKQHQNSLACNASQSSSSK